MLQFDSWMLNSATICVPSCRAAFEFFFPQNICGFLSTWTTHLQKAEFSRAFEDRGLKLFFTNSIQKWSHFTACVVRYLRNFYENKICKNKHVRNQLKWNRKQKQGVRKINNKFLFHLCKIRPKSVNKNFTATVPAHDTPTHPTSKAGGKMGDMGDTQCAPEFRQLCAVQPMCNFPEATALGSNAILVF